MNVVPGRRRSVVSVVVGALAMLGSVAVMGVLVLSDVADAKAPRKSTSQQVALVEQQKVTPAYEPLENAPAIGSEDAEQPAPKKRARKKAKVDFGRFEGY